MSQCKAEQKDGAKCTGKAILGTDFCLQHQKVNPNFVVASGIGGALIGNLLLPGLGGIIVGSAIGGAIGATGPPRPTAAGEGDSDRDEETHAEAKK